MIVDTLSFLSKNLYNFGLYQTRQYFFANESLLKCLPRYLPKNGRYILIYPKEHLKCKGAEAIVPLSFQFRKEHNLKRGEFRIPIPKQVNPNQLKELRILPCHGGYKSQWVYEVPDKESLNPDNYLSIDLGVTNFATCVESVTGTATIYDGIYQPVLQQEKR